MPAKPIPQIGQLGLRMSEIQIQHIELDDSDRDENSNRKLLGPIQVLEDNDVNRVVSLKKPALASLND